VDFVSAYDGDTLTVNLPSVPNVFGKNISVRVRGIDTPEIKGKTECEIEAAVKARNLVRQLLLSANRIDLVNVGRDKYFRLLADVIFDSNSLSQVLIKKRLAISYDGGHKPDTDWCPSID
jgi:endonuclease YncB( thermonuclease family)